MIIYRDIFSDGEMFSDALPKLKLSECGGYYTFETTMKTEKVGDIDPSAIGANASQEEAAEETETSSKSGFEFVLTHNLKETLLSDGSQFKAYLKGYFKRVQEKIKDSLKDDEAVSNFKACSQAVFKLFTKKKFDDVSVYFAEEDIENDGTCCLVDWHDDGKSGTVYIFKYGLKAEKF